MNEIEFRQKTKQQFYLNCVSKLRSCDLITYCVFSLLLLDLNINRKNPGIKKTVKQKPYWLYLKSGVSTTSISFEINFLILKIVIGKNVAGKSMI